MTRKPDIKSINCTSCGAGLDVLGGGRVRVHVCGYCGSELNAQDNYAVLRQFTDIPRPDSPFRIGMQGEIDGVTFTVIGTLGMKESWGGQSWTWVDHQVFSPTHGYGYLTVENGHLTFTRRYRQGTKPAWISPSSVEIADKRPVIRSGNTRFQYFESGTSEITFVEGEFNWRPRVGALSNNVSMVSKDAMLNFSASAGEEEVNVTRYLPAAEVYASFGVEDPPAPQGMHALLPYLVGSHERFLKWAGTGFAVVAVIMAIMLSALSAPGRDRVERFGANRLPVEIPFEIAYPGRTAKVQVAADVDNSWAYIGVGLFDPDDVPVFEAGRTVERYSGRDADGHWSEGSRSSTLRFIPKQAGTYTLEIDIEEADTWNRIGFALRTVTVRTQEGIVSGLWMLIVALGFALFALYHHLRPMLHQYKRMRLSDWSDD